MITTAKDVSLQEGEQANQATADSKSVSARRRAEGGASWWRRQKSLAHAPSVIIIVVVLIYLLQVQRTSHSVTLKHSVLRLRYCSAVSPLISQRDMHSPEENPASDR